MSGWSSTTRIFIVPPITGLSIRADGSTPPAAHPVAPEPLVADWADRVFTGGRKLPIQRDASNPVCWGPILRWPSPSGLSGPVAGVRGPGEAAHQQQAQG